MNVLKSIWGWIRKMFEKYPVVFSAVVIYLYYLLTSFNFFSRAREHHSFLDYVMEWDSLFFLWIAAAALLQVQKLRKSHKEEEQQRRAIERVLDKQQMYSQLVNDISSMLQDNVNNPLAVISITTQEIRRRFETDPEIMRWLDRIDGAMQRIHHTIRDLQAYESQKLIDASNEMLQMKGPGKAA
jgi:signal transduction histidine kinase